MANNIVAFNSSGVWHYPWSPMLMPTLENNDVYGSTSGYDYISLSPGATDISLDPVFVSAPSGDYHLQATSPCIDGGDNSRVPTALTADFDGRPRIIDGNGDASAVVDMGIYEFTSGTDVDAPAVTVTSPTGNPTYVTSQAVIDLAGTASDNVGITGVTWANDRGGGGNCDGTADWTAHGILLFIGQNVITVTARDRATGGNTGTDVITVTYALPFAFEGYVTTPGYGGIAGVIMDGLPSTPTTDASGFYTDLAVPPGWSGTVTPLKTGWTFEPPSRTYTNIQTNQIGQIYIGTGALAVPMVTTAAATSVTSTTAASGGDGHLGRRGGGHGPRRLLGVRPRTDGVREPHDRRDRDGDLRERHHRPDGRIHLLCPGVRNERDGDGIRRRDQHHDPNEGLRGTVRGGLRPGRPAGRLDRPGRGRRRRGRMDRRSDQLRRGNGQ